MAQSNTPRRPAMLDAARAEAIVGDEDPASLSAVAHTAAWALMGIGDETFSDEAVARLRETVRARGVDTIAHVWSRSSESSSSMMRLRGRSSTGASRPWMMGAREPSA